MPVKNAFTKQIYCDLLPLSVLCWSTIFIEDSKLINLSFLGLADEWIKYYAVFIDLFFIVSGFVIALFVSNKPVSSFFKSRVVRLFSVYWLCSFITYMTTVFFGAPRFHNTFGQFLFNLTLLQDFFDVDRLGQSLLDHVCRTKVLCTWLSNTIPLQENKNIYNCIYC